MNESLVSYSLKVLRGYFLTHIIINTFLSNNGLMDLLLQNVVLGS